MFQYNYCFGGIYCLEKKEKVNKVSIQLLFRWNLIIFNLLRYLFACFNTTIVSVELGIMQFDEIGFNDGFNTTIVSVECGDDKKFEKLVATLFQYNYCFGGI